jgi:hypothetical protein
MIAAHTFMFGSAFAPDASFFGCVYGSLIIRLVDLQMKTAAVLI